MLDLAQTFTASVERDPAAPAITDAGVTLTYAQWHKEVLRVAGMLVHNGMQVGGRVVGITQNRVESATLHLACQYAGVVMTPVNWRANAEELDYVLVDADATGVVYEKLTQEAVVGSRRANNIARIAIDADGGSDCVSFCSCAPTVFDPESHPGADALSVMLYTSGTTGRGKGVPRSHFAERAAAVAHIAQNQYRRGEVSLGVMPLYHTMGVRSLLSSIIINGHFICQRRFDPVQALELISRYGISNLYLVPTLFHDLLHAPGFASSDLSSVTKLGFAGQAMTDGLLNALVEAFSPELFVNHYGSSEIYTFTVEPNAAAKPGSAGKAGLNQRVRVVKLDATSADDLADVAQEGQIVASLAGDESFSGYWNRPEADATALRDGWYFTGDIGYFDAAGDLFVTGRVDDMIISGGENILPADIESVLSLHEGVDEVAVVGLADARWGQVVTAFVVRREGVDETILNDWCLRSQLADFKRPRRYVFVRGIPKSPVGKILRRKLVEGDYVAE